MPVPRNQAPTKRSRLRDDVYRRLRTAIVDGTLAPGEKLTDNELEEWLGVSRTPIREAIQRLERDGLVRTRPNKSTTVAPFDPQEVQNAMDVVANLQELAATLATPKLNESNLGALEDAHLDFERAIAANDPTAAVEADDRFHSVFVQSCGNPLIAKLLDQVTPTLRRAELARFSSERAKESVSIHKKILDAAKRRDAAEAAKLTGENWQSLSALDS